MTDINEQVATVLNNDATLASLVGTEIWNVPRRVIADKPMVVYFRTSTIPTNHSKGYSDLGHAEFQIEAFSKSLELAVQIAATVKQALRSAFNATFDGRRDDYDINDCAYRVTIDMTVAGYDD